LIIVLYVDDLLITGSFIQKLGSVKVALHNAFSMSDLGLLKQFLGLEIDQTVDGIIVS
jgi:ATP-binding cassette subfamily B (MDR/TAP) protein 1